MTRRSPCWPVSEHSLDAVVDQLARLALATVPDAGHAAVALVHEGSVRTAAFAGPDAAGLDEREVGLGPCTETALTRATIHLHPRTITAAKTPSPPWPPTAGSPRRPSTQHGSSPPAPRSC